MSTNHSYHRGVPYYNPSPNRRSQLWRNPPKISRRRAQQQSQHIGRQPLRGKSRRQQLSFTSSSNSNTPTPRLRLRPHSAIPLHHSPRGHAEIGNRRVPNISQSNFNRFLAEHRPNFRVPPSSNKRSNSASSERFANWTAQREPISRGVPIHNSNSSNASNNNESPRSNLNRTHQSIVNRTNQSKLSQSVITAKQLRNIVCEKNKNKNFCKMLNNTNNKKSLAQKLQEIFKNIKNKFQSK